MQWNFISQVLLYYSLLCVFLFFISDYLMYPVPTSYKEEQLSFPILKLTTKDNKQISALYLPNPTAKHCILFSHGNGENLWHIFPLLKAVQQNGFSVFAYDYHGYGTSEGRPSEKNTYLDIDAAFDYLTNVLHIPSHRIILYGRSIGSGPTVDLAIRKVSAGVILESPMFTAFRVVTGIPLFPIDKYRNNTKIMKIEVPVLFIHGTEDKVIPIWHSKELYKRVKGTKHFYTVEGAGHNNVAEIGGRRYFSTLVEFSNGLH